MKRRVNLILPGDKGDWALRVKDASRLTRLVEYLKTFLKR